MGIIGLIKKHINARLRSFETMEVVIVESVDLSTLTCAVRPKARVNVYGNVQDMPQIMNVPIALQKSGNSAILLPPKAGDVGTCVFSKYALDALLIDKDTVEITIPRTFDINDAMYIGGNYTETESIPSISEDELLIYHKSGAYIRIDSDGNISLYGRTITSTAWFP